MVQRYYTRHDNGTAQVPTQVPTPGTTNVLQRYHNGIAKVLQRYYKGYYKGTKTVLQRYCNIYCKRYYKGTAAVLTQVPAQVPVRVHTHMYYKGDTRRLHENTTKEFGT